MKDRFMSLEEEEIVKIALPLKQNAGSQDKTEDDFHRLVLPFTINSVEQTEGVPPFRRTGSRIMGEPDQ